MESQNCDSSKISHLGDQFWGISREFYEKSVTGNDSRETPRKFFKTSHHGWRIWGNSLLLLLGLNHQSLKTFKLLIININVSKITMAHRAETCL